MSIFLLQTTAKSLDSQEKKNMKRDFEPSLETHPCGPTHEETFVEAPCDKGRIILDNITQPTIIEAGSRNGEEAVQTQTPQNHTISLSRNSPVALIRLAARALAVVRVEGVGFGNYAT